MTIFFAGYLAQGVGSGTSFSENTASGYTRQPASLLALSIWQTSLLAGVTFSGSATAIVVTQRALYDAPTGGNLILFWNLLSPISVKAQATDTIAAGTLLLAFPSLVGTTTATVTLWTTNSLVGFDQEGGSVYAGSAVEVTGGVLAAVSNTTTTSPSGSALPTPASANTVTTFGTAALLPIITTGTTVDYITPANMITALGARPSDGTIPALGSLTGTTSFFADNGGAEGGVVTMTQLAAFLQSYLVTLSETLSVNTPATQTVGAPFALTGSYTAGPPSALDYEIGKSGSWIAAAAPTIGGGQYTIGGVTIGSSGTYSVSVRDHVNTAVTATSGQFSVGISATLSVTTPTGWAAGLPSRLSGTYAGSAPTGIGIQFDNSGTFTAVSGFVASGGVWSGYATPPAQGTHSLTVQETNNTAVTANATVTVAAPGFTVNFTGAAGQPTGKAALSNGSGANGFIQDGNGTLDFPGSAYQYGLLEGLGTQTDGTFAMQFAGGGFGSAALFVRMNGANNNLNYGLQYFPSSETVNFYGPSGQIGLAAAAPSSCNQFAFYYSGTSFAAIFDGVVHGTWTDNALSANGYCAIGSAGGGNTKITQLSHS